MFAFVLLRVSWDTIERKTKKENKRSNELIKNFCIISIIYIFYVISLLAVFFFFFYLPELDFFFYERKK